jgi:hypothetical protein
LVFLDIILNHFLNFDKELLSWRGVEWTIKKKKSLFSDFFWFVLFHNFFCVNSKFCHFQEKLKSTERKYFWKRKFSMQKSLNFFRWDGQTKIIIAVHIFTQERTKETCFNQTFWWFHLNNVEHILVQNKFLSFSNVPKHQNTEKMRKNKSFFGWMRCPQMEVSEKERIKNDLFLNLFCQGFFS